MLSWVSKKTTWTVLIYHAEQKHQHFLGRKMLSLVHGDLLAQRPWSVRYEGEVKEGCFGKVRGVSFLCHHSALLFLGVLTQKLPWSEVFACVCLCKVSSCSSVWSLSLSVCAPVSLSLLLSPQISEQMQSPLPLLYQGDKIWKFFPCLTVTTEKKKKKKLERAILDNACFQFRQGFKNFLSSERTIHCWSVLFHSSTQSLLALLCSKWTRVPKDGLCLAHWNVFVTGRRDNRNTCWEDVGLWGIVGHLS